MTLNPALGRQRQVDLCEFEGTAWSTEGVPGQTPKLLRNPISKEKKIQVKRRHE